MKQLRNRTIFVLLFSLMLTLGLVIFLVFYVQNGAEWAAYRANSHVYSNGGIASGSICDRNGVVLFDCETGSYSSDYTTRVSTVHAVGDKNGSIGTGAKTVFADQLVGFNLITGTSGTGNTVSLTLDSHLNNVAYEAMAGRKGAVALYNYKTGEVLCMLSTPAFDPEDSWVIDAINAGDEDYSGAYMNRVLASTYTPGSIFKLVTTAAALETLSDLEDFSYYCDGSLSYGDNSVTCPSAHGSLNLSEALSHSCNGAYATLANEIGSETLKKYAEKAGLLDSMEVSGLHVAAGNFTTTTSAIDEGWSGVGQYKDLVNPCAEMTLMGCIANGGSAAVPRLLKSVTGGLGIATPTLTTEKTSIGWKASTCATLKEMMRNNVVSQYGQDQFGELEVCAKSGTAEVGSSSPHAWFVGFIDDTDYPYAFAVVIENGGWGSSQAGSVAAAVINAACQ
jgi:peptidoglycan glycosyltransferase